MYSLGVRWVKDLFWLVVGQLALETTTPFKRVARDDEEVCFGCLRIITKVTKFSSVSDPT